MYNMVIWYNKVYYSMLVYVGMYRESTLHGFYLLLGSAWTPVWTAERGLWGAFVVQLTVRTHCNHEVSMKIWVWMLLQNALVAGWREAFFWCLSTEMCKNWSNLIPSLFSSNFSLMTLDDEHPWSSRASQAADWAKWELQASQLRLWFQCLEEKQSKRRWSGDIKSDMKWYE